LPFAVVVVLHVSASTPSVLSRILDRSGPLPATSAVDGEALRAGHIYVAVPDRHLMVADHRVVLSQGPTEDAHRPAINALFRSVALAFGPRAIGVLMSGVLDDGVLGIGAIKSRGGTTIVQDPDDALFSTMPQNAIRTGAVDHRAAAADIGGLLTKLAEHSIEEREMEHDARMELENRIAMGPRFSTSFDTEDLGPPSGFTCPDCNGSLQRVSERNYRCQVGHAWTADALLQARDTEIENALWIAIRSLGEKAKLSRRLADTVGVGAAGTRYTELADEAERAMDILSKRLADTAPSGEHGDP
jgi:two-component system, chemotaxis family, protein-glutamate methylesterase/glutaminase